MKNKLLLLCLSLTLFFITGSSVAQAETTPINTGVNTLQTTNSANYWQQFLDWLNGLTSSTNTNSLSSRPPDDDQCPLRICGSDPEN